MVQIIAGDALDVLEKMDSESVDMCITSPPYFNLRDYGVDGQIGNEETAEKYIHRLVKIFNQVKRVLKKDGSLWVNLDDVYQNKGLMCIPDMFKIEMVKNEWICRNEIIWHKPNAMPSSAKTRYNNDYEKLFFFTKSKDYYFKTQYEPFRSEIHNTSSAVGAGKYESIEQESSVRQGMNKKRGCKIIEVRKELPSQEMFVEYMRKSIDAETLSHLSGLSKSKVEHWFRRDKGGFSYPSIEDWKVVREFVDDWSIAFMQIDEGLLKVSYETDDIMKHTENGRIKRSVWDINTKAFKGLHYAPFPKELVRSPIDATCREKGTVLDVFCGSGTVGVVALEQGKNFIGIDLNPKYCEIAKERIEKGE